MINAIIRGCENARGEKSISLATRPSDELLTVSSDYIGLNGVDDNPIFCRMDMSN
jgi:hypothetical protein